MKILHFCWTTLENKITFWKKWPSRLRVKGQQGHGYQVHIQNIWICAFNVCIIPEHSKIFPLSKCFANPMTNMFRCMQIANHIPLKYPLGPCYNDCRAVLVASNISCINCRFVIEKRKRGGGGGGGGGHQKIKMGHISYWLCLWYFTNPSW